jgi:hypothetical protein
MDPHHNLDDHHSTQHTVALSKDPKSMSSSETAERKAKGWVMVSCAAELCTAPKRVKKSHWRFHHKRECKETPVTRDDLEAWLTNDCWPDSLDQWLSASPDLTPTFAYFTLCDTVVGRRRFRE